MGFSDWNFREHISFSLSHFIGNFFLEFSYMRNRWRAAMFPNKWEKFSFLIIFHFTISFGTSFLLLPLKWNVKWSTPCRYMVAIGTCDGNRARDRYKAAGSWEMRKNSISISTRLAGEKIDKVICCCPMSCTNLNLCFYCIVRRVLHRRGGENLVKFIRKALTTHACVYLHVKRDHHDQKSSLDSSRNHDEAQKID